MSAADQPTNESEAILWLAPLYRARHAVTFVWLTTISLMILSGILFTYQLTCEIDPGNLFRDSPGAWLHLAGHLVRFSVFAVVGVGLGRYMRALNLAQHSSLPDVQAITAALAGLWMRAAYSIAVLIIYTFAFMLQMMFPDLWLREQPLFIPPAGTPTVRVEFFIADDEPAEGRRKELLPDLGEVVYRNFDASLTNEHFARARVTNTTPGEYGVAFELTEDGARLMRKLTTVNAGKRMLIVIDGFPLTAPYIRSTIGQSGIISAKNFTHAEAERIALGMIGRR